MIATGRQLGRLPRPTPGRRGRAASLWVPQRQRPKPLQCLPRHFGTAAGNGDDAADSGLSIYDSLSSRRRALPPLASADDTTHTTHTSSRGTAWYACGPTVYDAAHLGHGRTYVLLDILRRVAMNSHDSTSDGGDGCRPRPLFVVNVTDVDDKIINRSRERGEDPIELARHYEREFWYDMDALNVLRPDVVCRVSEHVEATIVPYIQRIVDGGMAYVLPEQQNDDGGAAEGEGSVYFDVRAFESVTGGRTKYGKLAPDVASTDFYVRESQDGGGGNNIEEGEGDPAQRKRDPRDFCLWKYRSQSGADAEPASVSYPSPWGFGRPGWHVECSAMIQRLAVDFASTHSFGVHAGGVDLKFPHHSNEIAQAEAYMASGSDGGNGPNEEWIPHWIHTGHLYVKGRKMSKSLKNFVTVREMLEAASNGPNGAWSSPADDFRLWCLGLSGSYRGPATYSRDRMDEAKSIRERWIRFLMEGQECLVRWQSMDDGSMDSKSTRLWGDEELQLFRDVTQCAMNCTRALRDDLDGASFVKELNRIVEVGLEYIERVKDKRSEIGRSRPEEPLRSVLDTFRGQLDLVGFSPRTVNAGLAAQDAASSGHYLGSATNAAIVDEAVAFRTAVRSASLVAIQKKADGVDALKEILRHCDELRDIGFPQLGVEILDGKVGDGSEDGDANRGWRYCSPRAPEPKKSG